MWTLRQGRAKNLAALSKSVADRLGVSIHETIKFRFPRIDQVAHESLLGQRGREKSEQVFEFLVDVIIPDDDPISQFRLVPGADTPRNVFVNFLVREEFGYKTNAVLVRGGDRTSLQSDLREKFTLDDWGITLTQRPNYVAVESEQTLLEPAVATAVERAAKGLRSAPTLVYLANSISVEGKEPIPYSVVAALDPSAAPPLGPFLPPGILELKDDEIVLADWPESPLRGTPAGTTVTVSYFDPELKDGNLAERKAIGEDLLTASDQAMIVVVRVRVALVPRDELVRPERAVHPLVSRRLRPVRQSVRACDDDGLALAQIKDRRRTVFAGAASLGRKEQHVPTRSDGREYSSSSTAINPSLERGRQVLDGPYAGTGDRKAIDHPVNWHLNPST